MSTRRMSELLKDLLNGVSERRPDDLLAIADFDEEGLLRECEAETFRESGLFTHHEGIVLSTVDGDEFQITIVRSK